MCSVCTKMLVKIWTSGVGSKLGLGNPDPLRLGHGNWGRVRVPCIWTPQVLPCPDQCRTRIKVRVRVMVRVTVTDEGISDHGFDQHADTDRAYLLHLAQDIADIVG